LRKQAAAKAGPDHLAARRLGSEKLDSQMSGAETSAIFLIGFMGAGKSIVGRHLAERLGWAFEDLDERIEERQRRKVHEIFRESGEAEFRVAERAALRELLSEMRVGARKVVALGGGAFVQGENVNLIEDAGPATIFLDASVNELWRRCREQSERESVERPLLRSLSSFRALYKARRPHYARASLHYATDGKTVDEIAVGLTEMLGLSSIKQSRIKQGRPSAGRRSTGQRSTDRQDADRQVPNRRKRGEKN
jgi:shikimate kinase